MLPYVNELAVVTVKTTPYVCSTTTILLGDYFRYRPIQLGLN